MIVTKRDIVPSRYAIALFWAGQEPAFGIDLSEPACFACRWPPLSGRHAGLSSAELWAAANGLEIAHLKPHVLGGTELAANLVVLCARCHSDAPDYIEPEYMIAWIGQRDYWTSRLCAEIIPLLEAYQLDPRRAVAVMNTDGFRDFASKRAASGKCQGVVPTMMAALADYCRTRTRTLVWKRDGRVTRTVTVPLTQVAANSGTP